MNNNNSKTNSLTLSDIAIFSGLTGATQSAIIKAIFQRDYPPKAIVIMENEPCTAAYFIASGSVRIYRMSADGREQVLARMSKGMAFNTVPPLQTHSVNHASVETLTAATIYGLRTEDYLRLLQSYPDFSYAVLKDFANRLTGLTDLIEDISLHSVRGRLARFLLDQADNKNHITQRWTQDEIAEQLGTVRDVIGRTLRTFIEAGLIRRDRQMIYLIDRKGLEAEAEN
jgi:CRP/FNR family transcriptional regulator